MDIPCMLARNHSHDLASSCCMPNQNVERHTWIELHAPHNNSSHLLSRGRGKTHDEVEVWPQREMRGGFSSGPGHGCDCEQPRTRGCALLQVTCVGVNVALVQI